MRVPSLVTLVVAVAAAFPALAADDAKVATVNGVAIPQARLEFILKQRAGQGQPDSPDARKATREDLIAREVVSQEAERRGLVKQAEVAAQIDLARQNILINAFVEDYLKHNPVPEEEMKKEYERVKAAQGDAKEYRTRHILVESEDAAKAVVAKLDKGAKFEELAAAESKDSGSKDNGGDLDWNVPGGFVAPFGEAMTKLEKGKYTKAPVQTQYGWHVIRLDDVRPLEIPPFEAVKGEISQSMQRRKVQEAFNDLRQKAKVE